MKQKLTLLLTVLLASPLFAQISLRCEIEPTQIYLGESFIAQVSLNGAGDELPIPAFTNPDKALIEYVNSSSQNRSTITIINGKRSENVFRGRIFYFKITPVKAGRFSTGDILYKTANGTIRAGGDSVTVIGLEPRDDFDAILECKDKAILIDNPFTIDLTVTLSELPPPNENIERIHPRLPLAITADYLNFPEIDGLKPIDANAALSPLTDKEAGKNAAFTINSYRRQGIMSFSAFGDPFGSTPILFRPAPTKTTRDGTNRWAYTFPITYTPTETGDYTFGPVTIKGTIITGADKNGGPLTEDVFIKVPALTITVNPPPEEGRPEYFCGAVGRSLNFKTYLSTTLCKVGDPITLTVEFTGEVNAENIRPPELKFDKATDKLFRVYDNTVESESIEGGKRFKYRLRPLVSGTMEFPSIKTAYYNTVKAEYVTISSSPLPLQAEAATQIITEEGDYSDDSDKIIPEAIIFEPTKTTPPPSPLSIQLAPLLWLIAVISSLTISAVRRHAEKTRYGRIAANALANLRKITKRTPSADAASVLKAIENIRVFIGSLFHRDHLSLTAAEIKKTISDRIDDKDFIERLCASIASLEEIPYNNDAATKADPKKLTEEIITMLSALPGKLGDDDKKTKTSNWKNSSVLIIFVLCLSAATASAYPFTKTPNTFEWERAQNAMMTARHQEDFTKAADLYCHMATNGTATEALYYNMGTALMLAGKPHAAVDAFDIASKWMGTPPELMKNRGYAQKAVNGSSGLPPERYLLFFHYRWPVTRRINVAIILWNILWTLLILMLIPRLRRSLTPFAIIIFILTVIVAVSIFTTYRSIQNTDFKIQDMTIKTEE